MGYKLFIKGLQALISRCPDKVTTCTDFHTTQNEICQKLSEIRIIL